MSVNLKINKINEILLIHKLLNTNQLKSKQTYIERSSFPYASYLQENWPRFKETSPLRRGTVMEEAASWVDISAFFWLTPNDTSSSLLEELVTIIYSRCTVDYVPRIYTNLMYNYIIKLKFNFLKNIRQHLPYTRDYLKCSNL
jgi:hypothetical protein